ncbi:MAG: hypothetical protein HZY77_16285 [Thiobacillus sp.]|uniref:hypothetical protein n=1 Tax=Thiobacillus sp. TaxID=924 RepID=UPI00168C38E7|nr:hypothetical protein [Thiobacillus sp.]QLQ04093.1 MAG: hypothetical protein HZY77_16285 [Thiobacillus sp.]
MSTILQPPAGLRLIEALRVEADEEGPREWIVNSDSPVLAVSIDPAAPEETRYITPNSLGTLHEDTKAGEAQALQEADGRVLTTTGLYPDVEAWLSALNRHDAHMAEIAAKLAAKRAGADLAGIDA